MHRQARDGLALEGELAGIGQERAGGEVDERGLAGTVRPDHRGQPPGRQRQVDAVDRLEVAEALRQARDAQEVAHGRRRLAKMLMMPSGKNMTSATTMMPNQISQYSVTRKMTSLITRNRKAPTMGPLKVCMPPISVASTGSADVLQWAIGGVTVFSSGGSSAPGRHASDPANVLG